MSPKELTGILMRDIPAHYRWTIYAILAAGLIYRATPVVAAVLAAPAAIEALQERTATIEVHLIDLGRTFESRAVRDSARQERILCIQEVMANKRPRVDLEGACQR